MANDFLMEERKDFLVSPTGVGAHEFRDTAHFLKPFVASIDGPGAAPCFADGGDKYGDLPLKAKVIGWKRPTEKWKEWVDKMKCTHRSTWERAGILDAIMGSTFTIHQHSDLILEFLEKWCPATNSFVFPWGEATVTLEDTAVLGGYSVMGEWVLSTPKDAETQEIVKKLVRARSSLFRTKARKADQGGWMAKFMGSQSKIEHEAFLVYWLSRFVFPSRFGTIDKSVLCVAASLAAGAKIALAPPVLAAIYKNLSLWKAAVIATRKSGANAGSGDGPLQLIVSGLLPLVQVWIWERFPSLRPNPKSIEPNEPRFSRWHNLKKLGIDYLSLLINSDGKEFLWRPYASEVGHVFPRKLYKDHGYWEIVDSDLDDDLHGFIRCVRASELVGMKADCIEQYLPHRVGMQFGMDQEIPGHVARVNVNPEIAWNDYTRPIRDAEVYVPSCLYKAQCTTRYLNWWKKLYQGWRDTLEPRSHRKSTSGFVCPKVEEMNFTGIKLEADLPPPPGFSPKEKGKKVSDFTPLQDTSSFTDQEVAPGPGALTSPVACSEKINTFKSSKRKLLDTSSFHKISDFYAPVSPLGSAATSSHTKGSHSGAETKLTAPQLSNTASYQNMDKHCHEDQAKDTLSSTADNVNVDDGDVDEPAESKAKETEAKEVMDGQDMKKLGSSPGQGQRQSSITEMPHDVAQLEARISVIEKWYDLMKSRKGIVLPFVQNQTHDDMSKM